MPPLISVIIPAYNSAATIAEALDSVAAQTILGKKDGRGSLTERAENAETEEGLVEIIVVDDASTDGTVEVVRAWERESVGAGKREKVGAGSAEEGRRTEVIGHWSLVKGERSEVGSQRSGASREYPMLDAGCRTQAMSESPPSRPDAPTLSRSNTLALLTLPRNSGPAAARNRGIAEAKGEWIAFLDGDDAWLPWRLESQMRALAMFPDAAMICGDVVADWNRNIPAPTTTGERCSDIALREFVDGNQVSTSAVLVRREVLLKAGAFDERFRGPEDYDLWMRVAADGRIVKMDAVVARYRPRLGSLCMDGRRLLREILKVYAKEFSAGGVLWDMRHLRRRATATRMAAAAWTCMACGERFAAAGLLLRSWLVWPLGIRTKSFDDSFWRLKMLARCLFLRSPDYDAG